MKVTVTRIYSFEAAHRLPDEFGGPATRLHGHTYTLRVTVEGGYRTEDLDAEWNVLRPLYDHALLNDHLTDTTVEGLAREFLRWFTCADVPVVAVEVQEGNLRHARAEA